ncbi:MAG: acyltransferase family protein [Clostridia bacterium]|nr:acyltransferase family protein [Clostridia bacterium]
MEKKRIDYLDILKFFGILFIYVGHFLGNAGHLYKFVFEFHVPLFFFLSGCTENLSKDTSIIKSIYKKFKGILVPFYVFSVVSIVFAVLIYGEDLSFVKEALIATLKGSVRNEYFASSLWFLSCLFVVCVMFRFMKLFRYKFIIAAISIGLFVFENLATVNIPEYYNIKSALHYQIYYVLGYFLFSFADKILTSEKPAFRVTKLILFAYSFAFTALLFFGKNIFAPLANMEVLCYIKTILTPLSAIWFFLNLSYILKDASLLSKLGKETLYFCGSEYIIKRTVGAFIEVFVALRITNGATALIYSFLLLLLTYHLLVPAETKILNLINSKIDCFFEIITNSVKKFLPAKNSAENI